jgi:hypothetical protein
MNMENEIAHKIKAMIPNTEDAMPIPECLGPAASREGTAPNGSACAATGRSSGGAAVFRGSFSRKSFMVDSTPHRIGVVSILCYYIETVR